MRKDPIEIVELIFHTLENGRPFSINELSKETGIHNITIRRYVRLIQIINKEPHIEIIRTRHSIILRRIR